jgi:hypothetical protein
MTEIEKLMERLKELWTTATNTCGGAPPAVISEIREIERQLKELERRSNADSN